MASGYVPDTGDVVWLAFSPPAGREQPGHPPALVLSPATYDGKTGMMLCCPMTTQIKGYPFEAVVGANPPSAILSDQVKSLDLRVRKAKRKGTIAVEVLDEVRGEIRELIGT